MTILTSYSFKAYLVVLVKYIRQKLVKRNGKICLPKNLNFKNLKFWKQNLVQELLV
jgi:hypothetical protein